MTNFNLILAEQVIFAGGRKSIFTACSWVLMPHIILLSLFVQARYPPITPVCILAARPLITPYCPPGVLTVVSL